MDPSDPDFIKTCCSRCKYKLYSILDSKGGVMCRFFWRDEECEYYKSSKEMKPILLFTLLVQTYIAHNVNTYINGV
jgi:hypothetical protein